MHKAAITYVTKGGRLNVNQIQAASIFELLQKLQDFVYKHSIKHPNIPIDVSIKPKL